MFDKVLIANRGEIALRILRACQEMGIRTVVVFSEGDRGAPYVEMADQALCIGPSASDRSYLNQSVILFAAEVSGAQAIHPGYGFLSENADFAEHVEAAGLTFIGPTPLSIRTMGDKIAAKRTMIAAGVPCIPGPDTPLPNDISEIRQIANGVGYPVIVKAVAGGGGRGMKIVARDADLPDAVAITRQEARNAFGNPELYLEKFMGHPRHVEIQVLGDAHGNAIWLGDRDCSMQRRHQKLIEEAPAPCISRDSVEEIAERCAEACRRMGYRGVGTFEFLYEDGAFYFIEMNTRLQVEHPVTEATTGIDIVQQQIKVARGEPLALEQSDVAIRGHAIECRINAEDPFTFLPSPGRIATWSPPVGEGIRVDSHVTGGYVVPPYYDSLIAKLVVHDDTRDQALERMRSALSEFQVEGIQTNIPLHRELLDDEPFCRGGVDIHHLEKRLSGR